MSFAEQREESVFEAALQLPADQRAAYLDQECAGDTTLRWRVDVLLGAFERAGGFMKQPAVPTSGQTIPFRPLPTEKPGDMIGRYKLLEQIGEGGCGIVYVAEQEEPVRRRVALKVIKLGMDTKQVIVRFDAERQALAMMDHPNIAKVHDAGSTDTGRPYFVMELVRGHKITDYCNLNDLPPRDRLDLFIQVCRAIQHAHQKGVIHRDIKPSNILVTLHDGQPVPKVIDFGIAKASQGRLTDQTVYTAFEQFIGTPAYMSPEQAEMSGVDIDTRSDIYSLGVLLYELLTGTTPFDAKELLAAGLDEMRRTFREVEPVKPSTRLTQELNANSELRAPNSGRDRTSRRLLQEVRGDLDWIVMKCLEKDRTRRYETANGLAVDVQRHLDNEPVVARPPGKIYRFQKLVRRNKLAFAAGAAVAAVLVIGVVASAWQAVRATRAEREQSRLRQDAQSKGRMLVSMLEYVGPSKALGRDTLMLREILDETVRTLNEELKNQPEVEAELLLIIGKTYRDLAMYPEAEAMVREALRLREVRFGYRDPATAEAFNDLGAILYEKGDLAAAKEMGLKAVTLMEELGMPDSVELASALHNLGSTLQTLNDLDGAEPLHRRALAMRMKLLGGNAADVAKSCNSLANVLLLRGNFVAAEGYYSSALGILKRQPRGITNPAVATITHNLAILVGSRGDLIRAEIMQREVLTIRRTILSNDHRDLAVTLNELAVVLAAQGTPEKVAEAEECVAEAAQKKLLPNDHWRATTTINTLAMVLSKKGDLTAAEAKFREALNKRRELVGDTNLLTVESLNHLAVLLAVRGDLTGAETHLTDALGVRRAIQGDDNPALIKTLLPLAWAKQQQGDARQAESLRRQALSLGLRHGDHGIWAFLETIFELADSLQVLGKFVEADVLLNDAFEYLEKNQIQNAAFQRHTLSRLVRLYEAWGRLETAAEWKQKLAGSERPEK